MPSLPFQPVVARTGPAPAFQIGARHPHQATGDACCTPVGPLKLPERKLQRATLADLDLHLHCSIVGTCLTTAELRKLVPRYAAHIDRKSASDLEIHHAAVELCCEPGPGRKEINKALDTRHALAIRKFKAAADADALRALWTAAMASGEVPGAYWALMTHPQVTPELRGLAFGDVHMLSHLVGASNRADIRRLVALEAECQALKEQNERQQARLRDMHEAHAAALRDKDAQLQALAAHTREAAPPADVAEELANLRAALAERDTRLALHVARSSEAERKAEANAGLARALELRVEQAEDAADQARAETATLEQALGRALDPHYADATLPALDGRRIVYVGGRPGTTTALAALVAAAGGELVVHDGGIEDRKNTLGAVLARAALVVFPVDCISHNAVTILKRSCDQGGIAYHPLRSSSVASFILLMQRLHAPAPSLQQPPRSAFCLRHG